MTVKEHVQQWLQRKGITLAEAKQLATNSLNNKRDEVQAGIPQMESAVSGLGFSRNQNVFTKTLRSTEIRIEVLPHNDVRVQAMNPDVVIVEPYAYITQDWRPVAAIPMSTASKYIARYLMEYFADEFIDEVVI
jgi:hypothetical protein